MVLVLFNINNEPSRIKPSLISIPQKKISVNKGLSQNSNIIKTALSTKGSIMVPILVTASYFLARYPSIASDTPINDVSYTHLTLPTKA